GLRPQARRLPRSRHGGGAGMRAYSIAVFAFSVLFVVIGAVLVVRTAAAGGGVVGYVLGALFIVLGVARFTLERQRLRYWAASSAASSGSSTPRRCSRSGTARSRRRCTSRSGSSPELPSASRRSCSS